METSINTPWTIQSSYYGHNVPHSSKWYSIYRLNRRNRNKKGKKTNTSFDKIIEGLYELIYNTKALAF